MAEYVYVMKGLTKVVPPAKELLSNIWLSFLPGAKIGVIGQNGAGKSTLMKIMAGVDTEFEGEAWAADGVKVGYLPQEPQLDETKTVRENIMDGIGEAVALVEEYNTLTASMGDMDPDEMDKAIERMGELQDKIEAVDGWDIDRTVEIAMDALRVPDGDSPVTHLSGGEKRRVALCRLLLSKPDMLLLDEPTNHLDAETIAWLERFLDEYTGTVVCITHDRYFLDNVAGWILEMDHGKGLPFEGNYSAWLAAKEERLRIEAKGENKRQKTLARELEWVNASPRARQAKSKARISAYEELVAKSNSRESAELELKIPMTGRLGDQVVDASHISKGYEDRGLLIEDLSFKLPPGGIVGVIGANGAGKSTLFKMIVGEETPDSGEIKVGDTVDLAYVNQGRDELDPDKTIFEEITDNNDLLMIGGREVNGRAYCAQFNFKGADQQKKVGQCSGGERNRIHLAKLLRRGGNLLLLDEPTNDLDVDTLRALEEGLVNYPGCAVVISHDRWFLDRIATHMLAFEGDSQVFWYPGGYSEYAEDHKKRTGGDDQPHRLKYKPISR